jgi:transposase
MTYWARTPEPREQAVLFPRRLDEALPPDHVVRVLDEILGRIDWSRWEARYDGRIGQPPIHPRVLAGVLLYGMWARLRSSRSLEEALRVRLDFRWLAEGRTIDHTTISEFRRRHSAELKDLFVQICQLARELGLLKLEELGFDGTRVRANNRRSGTRTAEQLRQERAELQRLFEESQRQAEAEDTRDEERFGLRNPQEMPAELRNAERRRKKLDAALKNLAETAEAGGTLPKRMPVTDPDARMMPNKEGGHAVNYTPTATVDLDGGIIAAADVLNVINEDGGLIPACEEVQAQFALRTLPAMAEVDWQRLPTHPLKRHGQTRQQLDKTAFVYDAARNCYWCPLGQPLNYACTTSEASRSGRRVRNRYQADAKSCSGCPLRERCVMGGARSRQINRQQYDAHRERHAQHMAQPESQAKYARRRHAGERPFATIKHQFGLRQFLLRGLQAVQDEWRWAVVAFNVHRMIGLLKCRAGPNPLLAFLSPSP